MTTIATDGKCVAFDGRGSINGLIATETLEKVREVAPGIFAGGSGDIDSILVFQTWMRAHLSGEPMAEEPKLKETFLGIVVDTNSGRVLIYGHMLVPTQVIVPFALGEGEGIALGAMLAGKHPIDAVAIAASRTVGTGGKLTILPEAAAEVYERESRRAMIREDLDDEDKARVGALERLWIAVKHGGLLNGDMVEEAEIGVLPHVQVTIPKATYDEIVKACGAIGLGHTDQATT